MLLISAAWVLPVKNKIPKKQRSVLRIGLIRNVPYVRDVSTKIRFGLNKIGERSYLPFLFVFQSLASSPISLSK